MSNPRILISSDHAGFELKQELQKLRAHVHWVDLGPLNSERVDYPDFAEALCRKIVSSEFNLGILICGSGIGMSIAANKFSGIRAAVVENPVSARLSREHNDSNVLCLGSRFLAPAYCGEIVDAWLSARFSTEGRHQVRIDKISQLEIRGKNP